MPQIINTNISALNAQRNLNKSQASGQLAMQRLSSGLRLNSAKDDTAGSAIASRMTSQVNGLNQATRNANDGISLTQTADGTLSEISTSLQRIRELAVQSANASNSASDRASLDSESQQLVAEITRQASQAQFNGINLLDGSFTAKEFQVGANANQTISINAIANSTSVGLGSNILLTAGSIIGANGSIGLTKAAASDLTGGNVIAIEAALTVATTAGTSGSIGYNALTDAKGIAAAINLGANGLGVTATATNSATLSNIVSAGTITMTLIGGTGTSSGGTGAVDLSASVTDPTDLTSLLGAINGAQATTGITATFGTTGKGTLILNTTDGRDIGILNFTNTGTIKTASFGDPNNLVTLTSGATSDSTIKSGSVSLTSAKGAITLGGANLDAFSSVTQGSEFESVASVSLTSSADSQLAIATVDAALGQINTSRGDIGAIQNRFASTINNLQSTSENMSASRSRIQDADFAAESAELSRSQVLQQAGTAMLAQANQSSQGVMALLR